MKGALTQLFIQPFLGKQNMDGAYRARRIESETKYWVENSFGKLRSLFNEKLIWDKKKLLPLAKHLASLVAKHTDFEGNYRTKQGISALIKHAEKKIRKGL